MAQYISRVLGRHVILYARNREVADMINTTRTNERHLPGITLDSRITAKSELSEIIPCADLLVSAVPAQQFRALLQQIKGYLHGDTLILNLAKGIEQKSGKLLSKVMTQECGNDYLSKYAVLSGPSFAEDIVLNRPIGVTVSGRSKKAVFQLQKTLSSTLFDVKTTTDLAGIEAAGALKNVFALAAGIFSGSGCGPSIIGSYITRAMTEIRDLGMFLGGKWSTFSGRSGLGDLVISCGFPSRNFAFGYHVAGIFHSHQQLAFDQILKEAYRTVNTDTVEGFHSLLPVYELAVKHHIFTPIIDGLFRLFYKKEITPAELYPCIQQYDAIRTKEGTGLLSIALHYAFPRVWYRRKRIWHYPDTSVRIPPDSIRG